MREEMAEKSLASSGRKETSLRRCYRWLDRLPALVVDIPTAISSAWTGCSGMAQEPGWSIVGRVAVNA